MRLIFSTCRALCFFLKTAPLNKKDPPENLEMVFQMPKASPAGLKRTYEYKNTLSVTARKYIPGSKNGNRSAIVTLSNYYNTIIIL